MHKWELLKKNIHLIILLLVVIGIIIVSSLAAPLDHNVINNEKNKLFEQPWEYSIDDGPFHPIELPYKAVEPIQQHSTLKNKIPIEMVRGATVLIRTSQQNVRVFVEDTLIYDSGMRDGKTCFPSSAFHFVRLPVDGAGKPITLVLHSPYERYAGQVNQIYIGSKASNVFFLLQEHGQRFFVGMMVCLIGMLLILAFMFANRQKKTVGIVYLGEFLLCAGFWVAEESKIAQFVIPYPIVLTGLSIFAVTLMPVFLGLYYIHTYAGHWKKVMKYLIGMMGAGSMLTILVYVANPLLPLQLLPAYLIGLLGFILLMFVLMVLEAVKEKKVSPILTGGILAFGSCSLLELIMYLSDTKHYKQSDFMMTGLLLFCVVTLIDLVVHTAKAYQASVRVKALTVLAYTDNLTGLKNRTAFFEKMSEIQGEHERITLAMYDINNLKLINDTKGHLVGDGLIRSSVHVMEQSICGIGTLYRVGGDEFVAILTGIGEESLLQLEKTFLQAMDQEEQKSLSYEISIAYGFATYHPETDKDIFATLARADKAMYCCKRQQKQTEG